MKQIRFIIFPEWNEEEFVKEFKEKYPDIKLEVKQYSEDTIEVETDQPIDVCNYLNSKTLTHVTSW